MFALNLPQTASYWVHMYCTIYSYSGIMISSVAAAPAIYQYVEEFDFPLQTIFSERGAFIIHSENYQPFFNFERDSFFFFEYKL